MPDIFTTKLFYVLLSAISFLVGVLILKIFRPAAMVRNIILGISALLLVMAIMRTDLLTLDPAAHEAVPFLKEAGWLALGLFFCINRGDHIVAYLDRRDQAAHIKEQQENKSD